MIEIEKKLLLTSVEQQRLLTDAALVSEKIVEDTYFDTEGYDVSTRDMWLRRRDGKYELKAPLDRSGDSGTTTHQYHEITDTELIAGVLELSPSRNFEEALSLGGIRGYVTSLTHRKSYKKQDFRIDIDDVSFRNSNFTYNLAEIELLVTSEAEAAAAEQQIIEFVKSHHLAIDEVIPGKIIAFLKEEQPERYAALVDAGVISE